MSAVKPLRELLSAEGLAEVDNWIKKYPPGKQASAVMSALGIVQEEHGYLTKESMDAVAEYLMMPAIAVYEVSTFYSMYKLEPQGRHSINVCTNISCKLADSAKIVEYLEEKLAIKMGETTEDGRFTMNYVECLGACVNAPMMQVDKDYHENLTPEKIDSLLDQYK